MEKYRSVALTGPTNSGKGIVSRIICERVGYHVASHSSILREEIDKRGMKPTRDNYFKIFKEIIDSGDIIGIPRILIERYGIDGVIFDSVRNPAEIDYYRAQGNVLILGVDISSGHTGTNVLKRYSRMIQNTRDISKPNLEQFMRIDEREWHHPPYYSLRDCLANADIVLYNDTTLEDLERKVMEQVIPRLVPRN